MTRPPSRTDSASPSARAFTDVEGLGAPAASVASTSGASGVVGAGGGGAKRSRRRKRGGWSEAVGGWPQPLAGVLWGLLCALTIFVLGLLGRTHGFEGAALDVLFQTRGVRYPSPQVAAVVIDEETVARLGFPIPRRYMADLVDYLKRDGARVIAFDIAFATPGDAEGDRRLAQACARAGNVVHAAVFAMPNSEVPSASSWTPQTRTKQPLQRFSWPEVDASNALGIQSGIGAFSARPELQAGAAALGHINVFPELDYGTLRRIPHLIRFRRGLYPSLALATAMRALGISPRDVRLSGHDLILGRGSQAPRVPLQGRGEALVNWIGGHNSYTPYALSRVISREARETREP